MFRFLDHTGDFALEVTGATPEAALEETARALVALVAGEAPLAERETRPIALEAFDGADLVVALGNELLFLFETERFLPTRLVVDHLDPDHASFEGRLFGERVPRDLPLARPAKAVTHHDATFDVRPDQTLVHLVIDL
ncbi:MAG: archease [Myxococcales bacterium]|nr:archease [Myxococcales bacterium]